MTIKTAQDFDSRITLDWFAYYERFKAEHGNPVEYKGKLLFSDGWTYSLTDYGAPEWPPPKNLMELQNLQREYWKIRLEVVQKELLVLTKTLEDLRILQELKNVPLQGRVATWDDSKRIRGELGDLELGDFEKRVKWLRDDVIECEEHLTRIAENNND